MIALGTTRNHVLGGNCSASVGSCRIVLNGGQRGNPLVDLCQRSPIRVMFPQAGHTDTEEAVLINIGEAWLEEIASTTR